MRANEEASGLQVAFLIFAVALLAVPVTTWLISSLGINWDKATVVRLFSLLLGALLIAAFSATRSRAFNYLSHGIRPKHVGEIIGVGALLTVVAFAVPGGLALWSFLTTGTVDVAGPPREQQFASAFSTNGLFFLASAALVAPVVEELVFRGFLLDAWQRRWGWIRAALLTSAVFGLYHSHFVAAFASSMIFASAFRRTGSLWAPILVHCALNLSLWYPLLGQYVFPPRNEISGIQTWTFHIVAFVIAVVSIPWYIHLAAKPQRRADAPSQIVNVP